jgi:hypothetical protein
MQTLVKKEWHGFEIEFEQINGQLMANATLMCAAFGKEAYKWLKRKDTKELVAEYEADDNHSGCRLVETRNGKTVGGGTWIHESLILDLAQWLNVKFKVQCQKWIAELLRTGKVELRPQTQLEMLLAQVQQAVELERRQVALEVEIGEVKQDVQVLAHTIVNQVHALNYFTVAGYYAKHGRPTPHNNVLKAQGKAAVQLSRSQSVATATTPHERYGQVKVYRDDILKQVLSF